MHDLDEEHEHPALASIDLLYAPLRACLKSAHLARLALLAIMKRPRHTQGFQVLQWRWIVERTFGWLHRLQRLSKDFKAVPATTETWIRITMIHLMVRHLTARA
jgi:transposase